MNYQIWGHTHRHAVEEILLHLLPDCAAGEGDDTGGDFCKSVLSVQGDTFTASASARVKGRCCEGKTAAILLPGNGWKPSWLSLRSMMQSSLRFGSPRFGGR